MRGIHRSLVNSPHKWPVTRKMFPFDDAIMWLALLARHRWIPLTKASDAELWRLTLIYAWINGGVNNREAGDLRRLHAYDVIVMNLIVIAWRYRAVIFFAGPVTLESLLPGFSNSYKRSDANKNVYCFSLVGSSILCLLSYCMELTV